MSVLLWCDINVWVNIVACDPMAMISNPADAKWQIKVLFTPSYCKGNYDKRGWVMTFWVWKIQNLWTVFYQSSLDHLSSQTMLTKGSGEEVRALHRLPWSCSRKLFLRQYKKSKGLKLVATGNLAVIGAVFQRIIVINVKEVIWPIMPKKALHVSLSIHSLISNGSSSAR